MEATGLKRTDAHYIGQAGEHLACYLFHMWQYNILQPLNPKSVYDFVVERDGIFKKVQVKTTSNKSKSAVSFHRGSTTKYTEWTTYQDGDFDYLCACSFPDVYVVPFNKLRSATCLSFSHYPEYKYDLNDRKTYNLRPI